MKPYCKVLLLQFVFIVSKILNATLIIVSFLNVLVYILATGRPVEWAEFKGCALHDHKTSSIT